MSNDFFKKEEFILSNEKKQQVFQVSTKFFIA